jgi:hypothetical protein
MLCRCIVWWLTCPWRPALRHRSRDNAWRHGNICTHPHPAHYFPLRHRIGDYHRLRCRKSHKNFLQLFKDLRLPLTAPTPTGEDNEGTIRVASHHRSSGRTRHMDIQNLATQEWTKRGVLEFFKIHGTANPADAMSEVLYRILFAHHFDRMQGYNGSPHAVPPVFRPNPNDNSTHG